MINVRACLLVTKVSFGHKILYLYKSLFKEPIQQTLEETCRRCEYYKAIHSNR